MKEAWWELLVHRERLGDSIIKLANDEGSAGNLDGDVPSDQK